MKRLGNTKLFILLSILLVVILVMFGVFIIKYSSIDKEAFDIEEGSVLYTDSLQYIKVGKNARIEKKLDGKYYLYETEGNETTKYKLGKSVIVSKNSDSYIDLYGDAYQVLITGSVVYLTKSNKVSKSSPTKLFKLDDRKYLMVDSSLSSKGDSVVNTSGYVYIELDKKGNATFANNEILFKTINPIVLSGTRFDFDIANEKLSFDKTNIDLKSVIGSSNTYKKVESSVVVDSDEKKDEENKNDNTGNNGNNNGNGTSNKADDIVELDVGYYDDYLNSIITSVNNLVVSLRNANDTSSKLISQKTVYYDFNKWVALKGVASTSSTINVSYSVFDPNSEYDVVFVKLIDTEENSKTYYLNKNNTSYIINDLKPDTEYNLEFGYKTNKSNKEIIEDEVVIATMPANYDLKVTKIRTTNVVGTNNVQLTIFYSLQVDFNYKFKTADLTFTSNGNELKKITLSNDTSNNSATVINSDEISDKGIYEGSFDLEQNVTLDLAGAANVLSLDNVVICKRSGTNDCSVDNNINVIYKFYND